MKHTLRLSAPACAPAPSGTPDTPRDSVRSWLGVMVGMIAAPESERRAVREELESHLRDRVRDLMVGGASESDATRQAIGELGDAATLARRYQDAIKPSKRRLLMHVGVLSFAGAAAVLSVVALTSGRQPEAPVTRSQPELTVEAPLIIESLMREYHRSSEAMALQQNAIAAQVNALAAESQAQAAARSLAGVTFEAPIDDPMAVLSGVRIEVGPTTTWSQFFEMMTPKGGTLSVRSEAFEASGVSLGEPVAVGSFSGTAADAINAVNAIRRGSIGDEIGVRVDGAAIVVAPAGYFDALEQTLATYDLSPLIRQRSERTGEPADPREVAQEVQGLITSFVFSDHWAENGGDRASMKNFESRLFVQAPKRFHPKIAWILKELGAGADQPAIGVKTSTPVPVLANLPLLSHLFATQRNANASTDSGPLVQEKLAVKAQGEMMVITAEQSRVVLDQGGVRRSADAIEIELPDGWFVRDEWGRMVVPDKTVEPGGRVVTFTAPYGGLFGVWRRTGITGDRHEICPPGTPVSTPRTPS